MKFAENFLKHLIYKLYYNCMNTFRIYNKNYRIKNKIKKTRLI